MDKKATVKSLNMPSRQINKIYQNNFIISVVLYLYLY